MLITDSEESHLLHSVLSFISWESKKLDNEIDYPLPSSLLLLILESIKSFLQLYSRSKGYLWFDSFCTKFLLGSCSGATKGDTEASEFSQLDNPSSRKDLWQLLHEICDDICYISHRER